MQTNLSYGRRKIQFERTLEEKENTRISNGLALCVLEIFENANVGG